MLKVKQHKKEYGITNGKLWFAYTYQTKEKAESLIQNFNTPEKIRINICYSEPMITEGNYNGTSKV